MIIALAWAILIIILFFFDALACVPDPDLEEFCLP